MRDHLDQRNDRRMSNAIEGRPNPLLVDRKNGLCWRVLGGIPDLKAGAGLMRWMAEHEKGGTHRPKGYT